MAALILVADSLASQSQAQQIQKFKTYGEALSQMLGLGLSSSTFAGTDQNSITCRLGVQLDDADQQVTTGLSRQLADHCKRGADGVNGGASLGGSLLSSQPTRTVSQFITRRDRAAASSGSATGGASLAPGAGLTEFLFGVPQAPTGLGFTQGQTINANTYSVNGKLDMVHDWPSGMVSLTNGNASVFAAFSYERRESDGSIFQSGYGFNVQTAMIGAAFRVSAQSAVGINAYWGQTRGTIKGGGAVGLDPTNLAPLSPDENLLRLRSFDDICQMPRDGKARNREIGGSIFGLTSFGDGFFNAEVGAARLDMRSRRNLCLQVNLDADGAEGSRELSRGIISANVTGYRLDAKLRSGYDFRVLGMTMGPRAGLDAAVTRLGAYQESEASFGSDGLQETGYYDGTFLHSTTGAALAVNAQTITSLQSRLGMFMSIPFSLNAMTITPFAEATYIHEFANGQREIVARFAGDNRGAGASWFSFLSDKPDRDYFELAGGVGVGLPGSATGLIAARKILGNDRFDGYTVEGSVRMPF